MNLKLQRITFEAVFFYSCLGVSLLAIILNPSNPTLDGPSHLYNARLINYLISGNQFINHYYALNKIPAANLTDHYLLAVLMSIFKWRVAEKILVVLYLVSFSLLFRKLVRQWNDANTGLSIFAIPFSFSSFYYMGFYNFCLSFPILFGIIIYYYRNFNCEGKKPSFKKYFVLGLLATILYFTNGLAFLFAGLALFLFEFQPERKLKIDIKRLFLFFLVWVPGIICFIIFLYKVPTNSDNKRIALHDLFNYINAIKMLTVDSGRDEVFTRLVFCLILIALFSAIYGRIKHIDKFKLKSSDTFLLLSAFSLLCFVLVPNDASVGLMAFRFSYFFFIFLIVWLALQPLNKIFTRVISLSLIAIHFCMFFGIHQPIISDLNKQVELVENAGKVIKPNSIVLTEDNTGNWLLFHFADYLGVDKPLIILPNNEANAGWFATTWNKSGVPRIMVGDKDSANREYKLPVISSNETKTIDYIFLYGNYKEFQQKPDWKSWDKILNKEYLLIYTSSDTSINIFSLHGK